MSKSVGGPSMPGDPIPVGGGQSPALMDLMKALKGAGQGGLQSLGNQPQTGARMGGQTDFSVNPAQLPDSFYQSLQPQPSRNRGFFGGY